ncbi:MAG TPA: glycoside hydrolase family 16 protein [Terriglobia bacterium]|nr:glycoside hydrolase family 16 protein [Terriglobia bacterium]
MRSPLSAALFLFLATSLAQAQAPGLPGWKLVWSDEFNYSGHPAPEKWGYEEGYVRHNELQYYTVNRLENARVDGQNLLIELRKETPGSFLPTSINDEWHRYTSASLNTRNTAWWTYGRFEIRARMPEGKGTWPAIWFLSPLRTPGVPGPPQPRRPDGSEVQGAHRGPNTGESAQGEIDLMESWGSHPNEVAVHIHGTKGPTPSATVPVDDLYGKFHVYALEWYPDHMDFFLDGRKILTYTKDPATGWAFDHPMYLIMNIACGGPDEPAPDNSKLPQFMTVDYVRVYQETLSTEPR